MDWPFHPKNTHNLLNAFSSEVSEKHVKDVFHNVSGHGELQNLTPASRRRVVALNIADSQSLPSRRSADHLDAAALERCMPNVISMVASGLLEIAPQLAEIERTSSEIDVRGIASEMTASAISDLLRIIRDIGLAHPDNFPGGVATLDDRFWGAEEISYFLQSRFTVPQDRFKDFVTELRFGLLTIGQKLAGAGTPWGTFSIIKGTLGFQYTPEHQDWRPAKFDDLPFSTEWKADDLVR